MSHEELPRPLLRHLRAQLEAYSSAGSHLWTTAALRWLPGSASTLTQSKKQLSKTSPPDTAWSTTVIDHSGNVFVAFAFLFFELITEK